MRAGEILANIDNAMDGIKEIALQLKKLNEMAYYQYKPIAADLCSRVVPLDEVEYVLDRMMDFCAYDEVLKLFKDVCRHYFDIYPEMIAFQIQTYREMWDSE